jgi:hypothetical protein
VAQGVDPEFKPYYCKKKKKKAKWYSCYGKQYGGPQNIENRTTVLFSKPTSAYLLK